MLTPLLELAVDDHDSRNEPEDEKGILHQANDRPVAHAAMLLVAWLICPALFRYRLRQGCDQLSTVQT